LVQITVPALSIFQYMVALCRSWLFWSLVHLFLLAEFRNRLVAYVNWSWAWFTYGRSAQLITGVSSREDTEVPMRNEAGQGDSEGQPWA
jgi:NADH:ubiquinone reductase (H+-translocating)